MKHTGINILLSGTLLLLGIVSGCTRNYDYPPEPVLKFKEFIYVENDSGDIEKGILVLEFTDGDGDIGLDQGDTLPPYHHSGEYYYNFFIDMYTKHDDKYLPVIFPDSTYTFNSRIPPIVFNGKSKAIKGEIEYTFDMLIMKPFLQSDTIRINTFIVDRALHKSNVVITPDIPIL
ncbi:MAG: hypothetical protein R6V49_11330 [Bacteroidales bacterium]